MRTRVKICGLRSKEDIHMVADAGADAIGLVVLPLDRRIAVVRIENGCHPLGLLRQFTPVEFQLYGYFVVVLARIIETLARRA